MNIIISGSNGLIGHYLRSNLSPNHTVIPLDIQDYANPVDVTNEMQVKNFFLKTKGKFEDVHAIINCIGDANNVSDPMPNDLSEVSKDSFERYISINLTSVFSIMREYICTYSHCKGNIINMSSMYSQVVPRTDVYGGGIKHPGYVASKYGLIGLTEYVAVLSAQHDIKANCVAPGAIIEGFTDGGKFLEGLSKHIPLKVGTRLLDILGAVKMLIDNKNMTGQNLLIDGGYSLW